MALPAPKKMAQQLASRAPSKAWLRALTDDLDRQLRTDPLERFLVLWGLSATEAAQAFGVTRQALSKWRKDGIPADRSVALADISAATDLLDRKVKREAIPAVVRRPAAMLGDRSLYDLACDGLHEELLRAVERMFNLRRVQP